MKTQYSQRNQPTPRDTDITKYNSKVLYQQQGRKQVQQSKCQQDIEQSKGIKIVKTNQPKDTFRTLDPQRIQEKEEPLFQNKRQVNQNYPTSQENLFGHYYDNCNEEKEIAHTKRVNTTQNQGRSSSQSQPLNLFAPDNNPPVYSTLNKNSTSLKPEHFQKRLIKQNEYKMYDYGSSVNLPNQQVIREPVNDASQTERQTFTKAHTRKYQLDVTSSIDCLPGVFYKSPQQFKQPPKKDEAFMKRLLMTSTEREQIEEPKYHKPKTNIKNEQSKTLNQSKKFIQKQNEFDSRLNTKRLNEKSRGVYDQQFEIKDNQGPMKNPDHQFTINKFKTQVSQSSMPSSSRMNLYKTNFVLG